MADLKVQVPELGEIVLDIAYGGNFYAIVPAASVGLDLVPGAAKEIVRKGSLIRDAISEQVEVQHPTIPAINRCSHVRFIAPSRTPNVTTRNAVLYSAEAIDRSPCGTGTSAEMAARFAKGLQRLGEAMVSESIIGSLFQGTLVETTQVGPFTAVIPTIRGRAFISGFQNIVLDSRDPFPRGFYLGESSQWGAEF
jgi:proline racemase